MGAMSFSSIWRDAAADRNCWVFGMRKSKPAEKSENPLKQNNNIHTHLLLFFPHFIIHFQ
jgi:hypothetical protein